MRSSTATVVYYAVLTLALVCIPLCAHFAGSIADEARLLAFKLAVGQDSNTLVSALISVSETEYLVIGGAFLLAILVLCRWRDRWRTVAISGVILAVCIAFFACVLLSAVSVIIRAGDKALFGG